MCRTQALIMKPRSPTCRNVASCRAGIDPCNRTDQDWCHGVGDGADVRHRHPQRNTVSLLPSSVAGQTIEYITLDDGGDTTRAVQNAKRLIQQHKVGAIIGPSTTPQRAGDLPIIAGA